MIVSRPQWLSDTEEGTMMLPWRGAEGRRGLELGTGLVSTFLSESTN